jgi:hypothetical protein
MKIIDYNEVCIIICFFITLDMFQIGRLGSNDFVVKGPLHYDDSMMTCGPLSRYACRIEVSRKAPFTAKIFAAGFSESQVLYLYSYSAKDTIIITLTD